MLILTFRIAETIMIGDDISIIVLGVKGNQVRLGSNAPKSLSAHRNQLFQSIKQAQTNGMLDQAVPLQSSQNSVRARCMSI